MAITVGTTYDVTTGAGTVMDSCALDDTHIVYVFRDSDNYVKAKIGTISGTDISFGSLATADTASAYGRGCRVCKIDSTHFALAYNMSVSGYGYITRCIIGSVSGDTITFGSIVNESTDGFGSQYSGMFDVKLLDSTHIVVSYRKYNSGSPLICCKIGTISGTAVSFGSEYATVAGSGSARIAILDSTHFVIMGMSAVYIGTVNGSYEISYGSAQTFDADSDEQEYLSICSLDSTHIVILYGKNIGGYRRPKAIAGSIASGTITFGSIISIYSDSALANIMSITALSSTKFIIYFGAYASGSGYSYQSLIGTLNGTSISLSDQTSISTSTSYFPYTASVSKITINKFVYFFDDANDSQQLKSNIGTIPAIITLIASYASFVLTGQSAIFNKILHLSALNGTFTLTGFNALLKRTYAVVCSFGSFVLTGQNAIFNRISNLIADAGSFVLTGFDVILFKGKKMIAEAGMFVLTGQDVLFHKFISMTSSVGTFVLTGEDAIFRKGYQLFASVGTYVLTGQNAILYKILKMAMGAGTFTLTGFDLIAYRIKTLIATVGNYTLTGFDALLYKLLKMSAGMGSFVLTGYNVTLFRATKMIASVGTYTLTGFSIGVKKIWHMAMSVGTFVLTGFAAHITGHGDWLWKKTPKDTGGIWNITSKN